MIRFFRNALMSVFVFLGLIAYKLHSLDALHEVFVWTVAALAFTLLSCIELVLYLLTQQASKTQPKTEINKSLSEDVDCTRV